MIVNGYKMIFNDGAYTYVKNNAEAVQRALGNPFTLVACRYVKGGRWAFPVEVNEDDLPKTIQRLFARGAMVTVYANEYFGKTDDYNTWASMIEAGKSYMVGRDVPTEKFLKTHTSHTSEWQQLAHEWAVAHPAQMLVIETYSIRHFTWHVLLRGEMVEFGLPYHGEGGERHFVSHIDHPKSKVHVNED